MEAIISDWRIVKQSFLLLDFIKGKYSEVDFVYLKSSNTGHFKTHHTFKQLIINYLNI